MKIKILASILCFASVVPADDFKVVDGKEYKNVTVSRVEPDGIVLRTKSGISKLYFVELPKDVQERFHYNAANAAAYSAKAVSQVTAAVAGRGQPIEVDFSWRPGGHQPASGTRQRDRCRLLCGLVRPVQTDLTEPGADGKN
jgi:hypothetical protein